VKVTATAGYPVALLKLRKRLLDRVSSPEPTHRGRQTGEHFTSWQELASVPAYTWSLSRFELARPGTFCPARARTSERPIRWTHPQLGEVASVTLVRHERCVRRTADNSYRKLHSRNRPSRSATTVGGRQWYFVCPITNLPVSVVWKPPGAERFCGRKAWGKQVAYLSPFGTWLIGRPSEKPSQSETAWRLRSRQWECASKANRDALAYL